MIDALDAALSGSLRTARGFLLDAACHSCEAARAQGDFRPGVPCLLEEAEDAGTADAADVPADHPCRPTKSRRIRASAGWPKPCSTRPKRRAGGEEKPEALELDATFTASADEILRAKDFEQMTLAEQTQARKAIAALRLHRREILTRRFQPRSCAASASICGGRSSGSPALGRPSDRSGAARPQNAASRRWSCSAIFPARARTTAACSCISCMG